MLPFSYKSIESKAVLEQTEKFIEQNPEIKEQLSLYSWGFHSLEGIIPHTEESFWSGHFFPMTECFEELQVSYNLCAFGFYKQSLVSLRSALELGLLSVYWNLNDDGHLIIKEWVSSKEDTPRLSEIWKKLEKNIYIKQYNDAKKFKQRLFKLNELHHYVHSRGVKYSNRIGLFKSNFQTFEKRGFLLWFSAYKEIIEIITILHILKYPLGIREFDFSAKFGIDTPLLGLLNEFQIRQLSAIITEAEFKFIIELTKDDEYTNTVIEELGELPDLTKEDVDLQVLNWHKWRIEQEGFEHWKKLQAGRKTVLAIGGQIVDMEKFLEEWALEHDLMQPLQERIKKTT
ncbi:hypothetical protein [Pontibacter vulgaris]|uniref:hypothetical protein n=1 Tax=Pontibacter vulgaris TaxID=2905679 RepID=UPI001FA734E9|nr:hypothetical protein [Pontibacter vulgaris]